MRAWMQLIRPSNVLTAVSDVLAGVALSCMLLGSGLPVTEQLVLISLSSMLLYMGGIVFNDVFDAKLDQVERPERPIPSGRIKKSAAALLGAFAFVLGCYLARLINQEAFYIAIAIVFMCLLYNAFAKKHFIAGPIVMGMCRGLNLLLGMAVLSGGLLHWTLALVPIVYIASVTNISRGEVYGDNKKAMLVSVFLYALVVSVLIYFVIKSTHIVALPFIASFVFMIGKPLRAALKSLAPPDIRKAVKSGVLALILLNASWIAISGFWLLAIFVCLLLPLCILLAKKYSVT